MIVRKHIAIIRLSLILISALLMLAGCARMGQPDGGWFDDSPPKIVGTSPTDKATGIKTKNISITFDEFVKLEDATNKVVVSPPQLEMPEIKSAGKKIVVELKDSLKPNTTYTIDFSDAISDNNEGNPLGNYTYSFSTGELIDTFEVSGNVLDASNLEPIKGILVGLYDDLSDTAFKTKPMMRVSRTDSRGRFVIKGVAPGTYRTYALQDADGDYFYNQKSEMVAFLNKTFVPSCSPDIRQDTIWRDSLRIDSISRINYIHYYPDNVVLTAFTALQTDRYLIKTERKEPTNIGFFFSYGNQQLPQLRGLNFDSKDAFIVEPSEKRDTIIYWLRDTALVNQDTLRIEAQYLSTDSTGKLVNNIDTMDIVSKVSYAKRLKDKEKEIEKWQKDMEKAKKKGEPYDSIMPASKYLVPDIKIPSSMAPDQNVSIEMPAPLVRCDSNAIHLYSKHDSLWYRARFKLQPVKGKLRSYRLLADWRPGVEYSLEIDSAAFQDIYGLVSKSSKTGIQVHSNDDYGSFLVNISGVQDTGVVVQMMNGSDAVIKEVRAKNGVAEFYYISPGTYYLRAFVDSNGNNIWDTGDYDANLQPEAVYYYPKSVECKAKWDISVNWNLTSLPANQQKPLAITKQKPEQERKQRNRNADRARDLGTQYKP